MQEQILRTHRQSTTEEPPQRRLDSCEISLLRGKTRILHGRPHIAVPKQSVYKNYQRGSAFHITSGIVELFQGEENRSFEDTLCPFIINLRRRFDQERI